LGIPRESHPQMTHFSSSQSASTSTCPRGRFVTRIEMRYRLHPCYPKRADRVPNISIKDRIMGARAITSMKPKDIKRKCIPQCSTAAGTTETVQHKEAPLANERTGNSKSCIIKATGKGVMMAFHITYRKRIGTLYFACMISVEWAMDTAQAQCVPTVFLDYPLPSLARHRNMKKTGTEGNHASHCMITAHSDPTCVNLHICGNFVSCVQTIGWLIVGQWRQGT
jgi:hypothetical protein